MASESYMILHKQVVDMSAQLKQHINKLEERVDGHEEIISKYVEIFQNHEAAEIERHRQLLASQAANTKTLKELAESVEGMVQTSKAIRLLGTFLHWVAPLVVTFIALTAYLDKT